VPSDHKEQLEKVYSEIYEQIFKKKPDVMYHLNLLLNPAEALKRGVPVYRTDQRPGEFILTFPKAYHAGFSHGFNCAEAVNIVSMDWLRYYREAVHDYAVKGFYKKVSFSLDWMVAKVIENLDRSSYDAKSLYTIASEWSSLVDKEMAERRRLDNVYGENIQVQLFENKKVFYSLIK
jgi:histone demethylase JARID1